MENSDGVPTNPIMTSMEPTSSSRELRREHTIEPVESQEEDAASSISKRRRRPMAKLSRAYERFEAWFAV